MSLYPPTPVWNSPVLPTRKNTHSKGNPIPPAYLQPHPITALATDGLMDPDGMVLVAALLSDTNTAVHMRYTQYTVM